MNEIKIDLGNRSYPVFVGKDLLAETDRLLKQRLPRTSKVILVSDSNVGKLFGNVVTESLKQAGFITHSITTAAGEASKQFGNLGNLLEEILKIGIDRNSVIIALGGGVVGDLTGFAASILLRGIAYVQIPTSLLAQVDSSVGGKTAVNSSSGKNLIGSIYQPVMVLADSATLSKLPKREILAGYAEILKYGLLGDAEFFKWLEANGSKVISLEQSALEYAVARCVANKAAIVAADESEQGQRALLNLGHTFGHALEAWFGYDGRLLHGEAVSIGMAQAAHLSKLLGFIGDDDIARIKTHLTSVGLPVTISDLPERPEVTALIKLMYHDKKSLAGKLNFIVMRAIGDSFMARDIDEAMVKKAIMENEL